MHLRKYFVWLMTVVYILPEHIAVPFHVGMFWLANSSRRMQVNDRSILHFNIKCILVLISRRTRIGLQQGPLSHLQHHLQRMSRALSQAHIKSGALQLILIHGLPLLPVPFRYLRCKLPFYHCGPSFSSVFIHMAAQSYKFCILPPDMFCSA